MGKTIKILVKTQDGSITEYSISSEAGKIGNKLILKDSGHVIYELKDFNTRLAPDQMLVKRNGKNLEINLDVDGYKDEAIYPDIIIENYYGFSTSNIIGMAEDGKYYSYIPQEYKNSLLIENISDGAFSYQSLGLDLSESSPVWILALAPLAFLGGGGGGGNTSPELTAGLDPSSDSGTLGDGITNDTTPTISGTGEVDATISVVINGETLTTTVDSSGNWSVTPTTPLSDGSYTAVVTETDTTGNTTTTNVPVTIDATPPVLTITIDSITSDNIINATEATNDIPITGTVGGEFNTGDTVTITVNGTDYTGTVDASGNFSIDVPGSGLMADGDLTVDASITTTDTAGNSGTTTNTEIYTVDTTADNDGDTNTVTIDSITNDTGTAGDFITNDTQIVINGTVDLGDGNTLSISFDGTTYTAGTDPELTVDGSGNWTLDVTGTTLTDATYPVVATVTDVAGNTSSDTQNVIIDTTADNDGDTNTVTIDSITNDTGTAGDFITNDTQIVINGTVDLGDGNTLSISFDGTTYTAGTDPELTVDGSGNWTLDVTGTTLTDATYPVVATVTDVAGNTSSDTQNVIIDTTADNDGDTNTVTIDSITNDTGTAGDFITNDTQIVINGTVDLGDGNTLSISFDGTTYTAGTDPELTVDGSGNWTLDVTGTTLTDATYPVVATVTDVAGNTSSDTQNVIIDTTLPQTAASVVIVLDTNNDGTIDASEKGLNTTTNVDVGIPVDAQIGDVITVTNNLTGIVIATYTVDGTIITAGSTQTINGVSLPTGTDVLTVTAAISDIAGNIGPSASDNAIVNQTPIAIANNSALLGLVGADALGGIVDISHQAVFAIDANNNIEEVVVTYGTLVNVGDYHLTASMAMAAELGLLVTIVNHDGILNTLAASSVVTITALGGGPIDNLKLNELLTTIQFENQTLSVQLLDTLDITATDVDGLSDSDSSINLANIGLLADQDTSSGLQEGTSGDNTMTGTASSDRLYGYAGSDTLNGNGGNDLLRGGDGDDTLSGGNGNDLLIGGNGNDILHGDAGDDYLEFDASDSVIDGGVDFDILYLSGSGITLDLTSISDSIITGIEKIDITGDGDNSLVLNYSDLLALSDTSDILYITGNGGDTVTLSAETFTGTDNIGGIIYNTYNIGGTSNPDIWIQQDVMVL